MSTKSLIRVSEYDERARYNLSIPGRKYLENAVK
jgi:hypothetical protein